MPRLLRSSSITFDPRWLPLLLSGVEKAELTNSRIILPLPTSSLPLHRQLSRLRQLRASASADVSGSLGWPVPVSQAARSSRIRFKLREEKETTLPASFSAFIEVHLYPPAPPVSLSILSIVSK